MAAALLITTWIVTVSAARYADYSNVKMPQYGGNDYDSPRDAAGRLTADDYQGHSVDAPASLDYKFEEERRDDNEKSEEPVKLPEETERWHKLSRKHKSTHSPDTNKLENLDSYNLNIDNMSRTRSKYRVMKHRPRLKARSFRKEDESPKRRPVNYDREKDDNDIDGKEYFHIDKDFDVYKSKNVEDEEIPYVRKHTTERVIRRKPRDRYVKSPSDVDSELEELAVDRRMKGGLRDYDYKLESGDRRDLSVIPARGAQERYRPVIDEEEDHPLAPPPHQVQPKHRGKNYDDYHDYYDMKRVNNLKNKLPSLLRRTTVLESTTSPLPFRLDESVRRMLKPSNVAPVGTIQTTESSTISTTTSATTTTPTKVSTQLKKSHELSLAEKSRLSILNKALKKESIREGGTNKPPVLLQVTKKMITVVVVEPGTSERPWMRVRELSEDSPETIRQVKLLMRKKMIAEAKSMEELNEDWEEIVCDYVDMSLITKSGALRNYPSAVVSFTMIILMNL